LGVKPCVHEKGSKKAVLEGYALSVKDEETDIFQTSHFDISTKIPKNHGERSPWVQSHCTFFPSSFTDSPNSAMVKKASYSQWSLYDTNPNFMHKKITKKKNSNLPYFFAWFGSPKLVISPNPINS